MIKLPLLATPMHLALFAGDGLSLQTRRGAPTHFGGLGPFLERESCLLLLLSQVQLSFSLPLGCFCCRNLLLCRSLWNSFGRLELLPFRVTLCCCCCCCCCRILFSHLPNWLPISINIWRQNETLVQKRKLGVKKPKGATNYHRKRCRKQANYWQKCHKSWQVLSGTCVRFSTFELIYFFWLWLLLKAGTGHSSFSLVLTIPQSAILMQFAPSPLQLELLRVKS